MQGMEGIPIRADSKKRTLVCFREDGPLPQKSGLGRSCTSNY